MPMPDRSANGNAKLLSCPGGAFHEHSGLQGVSVNKQALKSKSKVLVSLLQQEKDP